MTDLVALVTGASGDIGAGITHGLADAGVHVLASGRDRDKLARIVTGRGSQIETVAADITNAAGLAAVRALIAPHGRLDVLVLGSGIYERSADPNALMRQFIANVHGPYALLQAVQPLLVASKGLVIFLNSTQGLTASPGVGQFAATQHAMRALADSTRAEVNSFGVRVTTIFLGRTATARQAAIFAMEQRSYTPERLIQPKDVAYIVVGLMKLPHTAEVMEIVIRPLLKPSPSD